MPVEKPPVRAAVVGTGGIVTGAHLSALRAHAGRVRLVGAVDVDERRLAGFLAEAGDGVRGYRGMAEMLGSEEPDMVLIGTPPSLHAEQVRTALDAGAWVLCEKPLCLSLAEFDAIAAAALDRGLAIRSLGSPDNNLGAVFEYLTGGQA